MSGSRDAEDRLRDGLAPFTEQLPPGRDDPEYMARYRSLCANGMHPAVAAVSAALPRTRRDVA